MVKKSFIVATSFIAATLFASNDDVIQIKKSNIDDIVAQTNKRDSLTFGIYEASCYDVKLREDSMVLLKNDKSFDGFAQLINKSTNSTVILEGCGLGWLNINFLINVLGTYSHITELNLASNSIKGETLKLLAHTIATNKTLKTLDLSENHVNVPSIKPLTDALSKNSSLTKLILIKNNLIDEDIPDLCFMLEKNTTLTAVNLNENHFGFNSHRPFFEALAKCPFSRQFYIKEYSYED